MNETESAGAAAPVGDDACPNGTGPKRSRATRSPRRSAARPKRTRRKRPVRWSARRETMFLEALAESSNIAASARVAGLSQTTVYRRRNSDADFRGRWMGALREGFVRLEADLLHRALHGTTKDVWHGGKKVGTVTEYSERLALALLAAHRATVMGTPDVPLPPVETLRAQLSERLDEMSRRLGSEPEGEG